MGNDGMKTKLLFISEGISFMTNAIEKNLQEAGYELLKVAPNVAEISQHKDQAKLIVFFLGKFVSDILETLVYLKDICVEEEKLLVLLGNPTELHVVEEYIPSAVVSARFERPIDMKQLTAEMARLELANSDFARRKNILLVDDDPTFLKMMKGWLDDRYRVTIVTSGAQALMYIADNRPDLILLDYEMPVTSGPQVLEMIRSETRVDSIPVIFLTGKGDRESVMKVVALKPDGYLLKSMSREQLRAAVADFFEKRRYEELHIQ